LFASTSDRAYVWHKQPCFVRGLNFVLSPWEPYFDPYSGTIRRINQWMRISRFPWEFWTQEALTRLLRSTGDMVRVDHNTLVRKKGKFARVSEY